MRGQTRRYSPRDHILPDLAHFFLSIQIHHVYGELHSKAMHGFARSDPQAFAGVQLAMFQQTCPPLRAGVSHVGRPKPVRAQQQAPSATFGSIIGLGGAPSDIVLDELRSRLYLVNNHSNKVDIYGIAEKALIGSIPVGLVPLSGAISMDGAFLFVTNQQSSSLSVIDLGT